MSCKDNYHLPMVGGESMLRRAINWKAWCKAKLQDAKRSAAGDEVMRQTYIVQTLREQLVAAEKALEQARIDELTLRLPIVK